MVVKQKKVAIVRFSYRSDMEHTLGELKKVGFPMAQISIVAKYADCEAQVDDTAAMVMLVGSMLVGSMLGAIFGCLTGLGILAMPGVSVIVAAGSAGTAITTLAGAGFGLVSGGLISTRAGLEKVSRSAKVASDDIGLDEFLVIVDGTDDEVYWAKSILSKSHSIKLWVC